MRNLEVDIEDQDLTHIRSYLNHLDNRGLKDYRSLLDRQEQLGFETKWTKTVKAEIDSLLNTRDLRELPAELEKHLPEDKTVGPQEDDRAK